MATIAAGLDYTGSNDSMGSKKSTLCQQHLIKELIEAGQNTRQTDSRVNLSKSTVARRAKRLTEISLARLKGRRTTKVSTRESFLLVIGISQGS